MLLDAGLKKEDAMALYNRGHAFLDIGASRYGDGWPLRCLMPYPAEIPTDELGLCEMVYPMDCGADLTVNGKPVKLLRHENFRVTVEHPPLSDYTRIMCCLYTIAAHDIVS